MRYISFCSGVEAATQAWEPLGWEPVAFSEIEPFPCAVLASRYPKVPNLGDCRNIHYDQTTKELYVRNSDGVVSNRFYAGDIDLCVGGFPCQSFSVAGKRAGLEGASGLVLEYFRLLAEIRPRWVVYENVPGMLSSNGGRDFRLLLRCFAECGYDLCWRTLDTQYVRVEPFPRAIPQRRRRVFVVGHLATDGGGGCEVLLEPEGVRGNPPPRRVKGERAAGDIEKGVGGADDAINCAIRGNRSASERGKLIESDFTRCAYTVTGVQTDSMAAVTVKTANTKSNGDNVNQSGAAYTIDGANGQAVAFKLDSTRANSMKSANPHSGIHQTEVHCALDTTDPNPTKAQGGVTIVEAFASPQDHDIDRGHMTECAPTIGAAAGQSGNNKTTIAIGISTKQQSLATAVEAAPTMGADDYKEPLAIGIGRDVFNAGKNAKFGMSISEEVQPGLIARGGAHVCAPTVGALCCEDKKMVSNQMVSQDKFIVEKVCGPMP